MSTKKYNDYIKNILKKEGQKPCSRSFILDRNSETMARDFQQSRFEHEKQAEKFVGTLTLISRRIWSNKYWMFSCISRANIKNHSGRYTLNIHFTLAIFENDSSDDITRKRVAVIMYAYIYLSNTYRLRERLFFLVSWYKLIDPFNPPPNKTLQECS